MHHILSESARRMWKDRLMAIIDQLIYGVRFRDTFASAHLSILPSLMTSQPLQTISSILPYQVHRRRLPHLQCNAKLHHPLTPSNFPSTLSNLGLDLLNFASTATKSTRLNIRTAYTLASHSAESSSLSLQQTPSVLSANSQCLPRAYKRGKTALP